MIIQKLEQFMLNGYKIIWTDHALFELESTYQYLENNFTEDVLVNLSNQIEEIIELISKNPVSFPFCIEFKEIRKVVILKYNTLYYRIVFESFTVEILSFFSNRQNPEKRII
jgi:plasmid stabilization system protein ParE